MACGSFCEWIVARAICNRSYDTIHLDCGAGTGVCVCVCLCVCGHFSMCVTHDADLWPRLHSPMSWLPQGPPDYVEEMGELHHTAE
eukprot:1377500-Amphidinium_carterae.1